MVNLKLLIQVFLFTAIVINLSGCDDDKKSSSQTPDDAPGDSGKTVRCSELDQTGTLDPAALKNAWRLPDGRRVVVDHRRALSTVEASGAVEMTLKNREACAQVYDVLHRENEPGYAGQNPLLGMDRTAANFERRVVVEGSEVRVTPVEYRGLEIYTSLYEEVEVTCRAKRLSTKVVKRLRKQPAPVIGQCAYPASYKTEIPNLGVSKNTSVASFKPICIKKNIFEPSRCGEEHVSIGGVYLVSRNGNYPLDSALVTLAWSLHQPDITTIEQSVRSAVGLNPKDRLSMAVAAQGISADDAFPVRAIGFSANGLLSGVKYWGLTAPHTPSNLDPVQRAMRPLLPQKASAFEPVAAVADLAQITAFARALNAAIGNSSDLLPWDREVNTPPPPALGNQYSHLVGHSFRDAVKITLEVNKPLTVFLVWSPTDNSRAILTEVVVRADGNFDRIHSKFINELPAFGLPADLLNQ